MLKNQYIIGKAIPIVNSNGGAYFNCYAVRYMLQLKLTRLGEYGHHIDWNYPKDYLEKSEELLKDVTWHIFADDKEVVTCKLGEKGVNTSMCGAYLRICNVGLNGFYSLDEDRSSFSLAPDMYIYLKWRGDIFDNFKGTSDTLCFHEGVKVWTPKGNIAPFIDYQNYFCVPLSGKVKLQKLLTNKHGSKESDDRTIFYAISYRGNCAQKQLTQYGVYRYRIIDGHNKTQWYTVNIMRDGSNLTGHFMVKK